MIIHVLSLSRFIVQPFTAQKNFPSEEESVKTKVILNLLRSRGRLLLMHSITSGIDDPCETKV